VCRSGGLTPCKDDINCGRGSGNRYKGTCDMDGADSNPFRLGDEHFFQPVSQFKIDTTKPFTVKTAFITDDGKETGNLIEVRRTYVQNGKTINGGSLTDKIVADTKKKFN
jgi:cellulose 1,4-beta-cellobiosidase